MNNTVIDLTEVTNVEIVDNNGRSYGNHDSRNSVSLVLSDNRKTLNVIISTNRDVSRTQNKNEKTNDRIIPRINSAGSKK